MSEAKSEMVGRVARALFETEWSPLGSEKIKAVWEKEWSGSREYWLNSARAAIAAMREPTEAMLKAAYASCDKHGHVLIKSGYRAMIDEALMRIAPEAPPAPVPGLEGIPGTPEGETGASGREIGPARDAGSGGAP